MQLVRRLRVALPQRLAPMIEVFSHPAQGLSPNQLAFVGARSTAPSRLLEPWVGSVTDHSPVQERASSGLFEQAVVSLSAGRAVAAVSQHVSSCCFEMALVSVPVGLSVAEILQLPSSNLLELVVVIVSAPAERPMAGSLQQAKPNAPELLADSGPAGQSLRPEKTEWLPLMAGLHQVLLKACERPPKVAVIDQLAARFVLEEGRIQQVESV